MFRRFFGRNRPPADEPAPQPAPEAATGPAVGRPAPGTRLYCIGDIHGRADLLDRVRTFIVEDLAGADAAATTIFLGDLIDRGPDTAGVLAMIAEAWPTDPLVILGNHERELLAVLERPARLSSWQRHGGLETLASYGVPVIDVVRGGRFGEAVALLKANMPEHHRALIANGQLWFESGDYFFCHAGVRPGVALADQTADDLTTIRSSFLGHTGSFGKIVVHGHTPVTAAELRSNRFALDTGAYATDLLTCAVLEDDTVRLFTTA